MSHPRDDQPEDDRPEAATVADRAARRRRLERVFGSEERPTHDDEVDPADRADGGEDRGDAWLRRQVPPHHG